MDTTPGEIAPQPELSLKNVAPASPGRLDLLAAGLMLFGLLAILWLGLLSAFLSGFLVYFLIQYGVGLLGRFGILPRVGRLVLALAIAVLVIGGLTAAIIGLVSFLSSGQDNLGTLLQRMVEVVDSIKIY